MNTRPSHVEQYMFDPDDRFPNSSLPLLVYRRAVVGDAAAFESIFTGQGWSAIAGHAPGVYPYHHFHSTAHEVLGFVTGAATVLFGGPAGRSVAVAAGDVVVVPAGVAHFNDGQKGDVLIVVAYPEGTWADLLRGDPAERKAAGEAACSVPIPERDPLPGYSALRGLWIRND